MINATAGGCWQFKNGGAAQCVTPDIIIVAEKNDGYACAHTHLTPNSSLIANLSDSALDADAGPIFGRRIFAMPGVLPMIRRACDAIDDEQFHSRVFEIFDFVSGASRPERGDRDRRLLRVQRMKRFIERNLAERVTLSDIAQVAGLSPFACLRVFKRAKGITPNAYLAQCRIEEATRLLTATRIDIAAVAERCGFNSQAYFARFFKSYTGMAPRAFRHDSFCRILHDSRCGP